MGAVFIVSHLTVLRHRHEVPVSYGVLVGVAVAAALARLAVIIQGMAALDLPDGVLLVERIVGSAILAIVAMGVMAYASWGWDRYTLERRRLLQSIIDSEEQLAVHRVALEAMSSTMMSNVEQRVSESRDELATALERLSRAIDNGMNGADEFRRLRETTDDSWSRLTADTWLRVQTDLPRVRARELIATMVSGAPFSPRLFVVGAALLYLFVFARVEEGGAAFLAAALWGSLCGLIALAANHVIARLPRGRVFALFLAIGCQASVVLLVIAMGLIPTEDSPLLWRVVVVVTLTLMLVLGAGVPSAIAIEQSRILRVLSHHLDESTLNRMRVESQFVTISQRLATRLHGHSRGSFLASTLRLKSALDNADPDGAHAIIVAMRGDLDRPVAAQPSSPRDHLELEEFLANWAGIIRIDVSPEVFTVPHEIAEAVHTVVIDAVTNAVRHGKCSYLSITATLAGESVTLSIDSDGLAPQSSRPGLGTVNLERFASGGWSRGVGEHGGTRVVAVIRHSREALS